MPVSDTDLKKKNVIATFYLTILTFFLTIAWKKLANASYEVRIVTPPKENRTLTHFNLT